MNKLLLLKKYITTKFLRNFKNREELLIFQNKKFKKFKKNVLSKSPYYKEYLKKELIDFPIMDKKTMMENFDLINTQELRKDECFKLAFKSEENRDFSPILKGDITVGLSSGTSGNRGLFVASEKERMIWAGIILAKMLPDLITKKQKVALFLRANSNLYETVKSNHIAFDFYDLLSPFNELINELNKNKPTILIAPSQVLLLIAKEVDKGNLEISPKKIVSAAEVLEDQDKDYMEKIFNMRVDNIYQCTEGFLGTTCKYGTLHINEDYIILEKEWLDKEKTRFVPILTDLERISQPIVRYRLDDVLYENKDRCECGSLFTGLLKVEGRCDDILKFKTSEGEIKNIFPDFIRNRLIINDETLQDYRIIQKEFNKVEIFISSEDFEHSKKIVHDTFCNLLKEIGVNLPKIIFFNGVMKQGIETKKQRIKREFNE